MANVFQGVVTSLVLLLSVYSVLKFAFFFLLPYEKRRAALDKSYGGRAYATRIADLVLLGLVIVLGAAVLAAKGEPISFLGGLFVGATLIQLFFHAFHAAVPAEREAPAPNSPLKRMSYAIQDRPARAWKEMTVYASAVVAGIILFLMQH